MAHYAFINENNLVVNVITGIDENQTQIDIDGKLIGGTSEAWEKFYESQPWHQNLICKRTSYNGNIRKNYAAIGFTYDKEKDAFIAPQPFNSWLLDEESCRWIPPIPYPSDKKRYYWNEETLTWSLYEIQE